jgi:hypothetical protein
MSEFYGKFELDEDENVDDKAENRYAGSVLFTDVFSS